MVETPAEAFAILGNDLRVDILLAVADAERPGYAQQGVQFSKIKGRVGVEDAGRLNYHLDKLRGHFLRRTDEGYRLRYAGWRVVRVVEAGSYHEQLERAFDAPGSCYACDGSLRARTGDGWLGIRCVDCEVVHTAHPLPPWLLRERSEEDILRALDADVRHRMSLVADRLCPECLGETRVTVREDVPKEWDIDVIPQFRCTHCSYWFHPPFGLLALDEPTVVEFLERHGTDPAEHPYWVISLCVNPAHLTVESRDPWRLALSATRDDETLRVTFDDTAAVREVVVSD